MCDVNSKCQAYFGRPSFDNDDPVAHPHFLTHEERGLSCRSSCIQVRGEIRNGVTQSLIERTLTGPSTDPAIYSLHLARRKTCAAEIQVIQFNRARGSVNRGLEMGKTPHYAVIFCIGLITPGGTVMRRKKKKLAPPPQNYPLGLRPGLHEPTGLARLSKSVRFPPSPLGDTAGQRPDRPHQRRPSPKKRQGTYNRQQAGQTLALYLT